MFAYSLAALLQYISTRSCQDIRQKNACLALIFSAEFTFCVKSVGYRFTKVIRLSSESFNPKTLQAYKAFQYQGTHNIASSTTVPSLTKK